MEQFLSNKNVLFIGYEYFDYHTKIREALIELGATVEYYPVMNYNLMYSFLRRISYRHFLNYNIKHGKKILKATRKKEYDYVFVIQGQQLSTDFFTELRLQLPQALFINYHWDAVRITEFGNSLLDVIPFFDKAYSFDRDDCEKYMNLNYLPLFYSNRIRIKSEKTYDLAFVGSITLLNRYLHIKQIERKCIEAKISFKYFLYVSPRDYIRFFINGNRMNNVSIRRLSSEGVKSLYNSAKVVLDIPNQVQSGLTIRTIEALADGTKLITNNANIKKESFYNENNIQIIDLDNLMLDKEFIYRDVEPLDMSSYHIHQWVKTLFSK
ncbi:MAG: hypothetical protein JXB49_14760 [Bacteroidales bacterium]|nr:hypothetical protein [Bacteroidales bacterium]